MSKENKMPVPVDNLTPDSSEEDIKKAISETISALIREGKDEKQAIAMAFEMAKRKIGKTMQPSA
jgi:hypothetical protein